jgi:hypothetical protein
MDAVNETLSDMAHNENKVRDGLKQLLPHVDSVVSQYGSATNLLSMQITLENHIARALDTLSVTQRLLVF